MNIAEIGIGTVDRCIVGLESIVGTLGEVLRILISL